MTAEVTRQSLGNRQICVGASRHPDFGSRAVFDARHIRLDSPHDRIDQLCCVFEVLANRTSEAVGQRLVRQRGGLRSVVLGEVADFLKTIANDLAGDERRRQIRPISVGPRARVHDLPTTTSRRSAPPASRSIGPSNAAISRSVGVAAISRPSRTRQAADR